ncbi:MAG TPA: nitroreductase [Polyangiales bacterium]|nr:nitroreductase [Polyangiales bacterium]
MDAIELLRTRASNGKLTEPAPDADTLRFALEAAARAPDHAGLRPWRVHLVRGEARDKLGALMAEAARKQNPNLSAEDYDKTRKKALRAPLIIVVSAAVQDNPKVPAIEQVLAAGAAAQNILLALFARGYSAMWRTGGPAYDEDVKRAFGLRAEDALVAFIYAGTPKQPAPDMHRPSPDDFARDWSG